jgi:hypothetical protein
MRCCRTMLCHAHGRHCQDCCGTTTQVRAVLAQPSTLPALVVTGVAIGMVQALSCFQTTWFPISMVSKHTHDPPPSNSIPALSLRI